MPKISTLRKHFPECSLSDERIGDVAEWLRVYLRQQHITPNNKLLKVLIAYEAYRDGIYESKPEKRC